MTGPAGDDLWLPLLLLPLVDRPPNGVRLPPAFEPAPEIRRVCLGVRPTPAVGEENEDGRGDDKLSREKALTLGTTWAGRLGFMAHSACLLPPAAGPAPSPLPTVLPSASFSAAVAAVEGMPPRLTGAADMGCCTARGRGCVTTWSNMERL